MENGAYQITVERLEQLTKHNKSVEHDYDNNCLGQLIEGAIILMDPEADTEELIECRPVAWKDVKLWEKMCRKPYMKRLVTAGALIAAEIDRLQYMFKKIPKL